MTIHEVLRGSDGLKIRFQLSLIGMLILYCDDSGTHAQSDTAIAASFISDVVQWEHFAKDWKAADAAENFGVFHMADFVGKYKQFSVREWQDEAKRDRTIKRLINITLTRRKHGFFSAVEKSAYDAEVPRDLREKYKLGNNHYTFAVRHCMGKVIRWRERHNYQGPIQYVFDRMSKGKGEIDAVFEMALKEGKEKALAAHGIYPGGWSFQNKADVLPLQASDILAWESLHYMQKVFLPSLKEAPRRSYRELDRCAMDRGHHDKESLRDWIAHVRSRVKPTE